MNTSDSHRPHPKSSADLFIRFSGEEHARDDNTAAEHYAFTRGKKIAQEEFYRLPSFESTRSRIESIECCDHFFPREIFRSSLHLRIKLTVLSYMIVQKRTCLS